MAKIQVDLARFEENLLLLQWLSNLCVNLGLLNVDKQTANAELKAENGWEEGQDIIEDVYLTLCLRRVESSKHSEL